MTMQRVRLPIGVVMVVCAAAAASAAPPATLSNGIVTARFGDRGLVSLTDVALGATVRTPVDAFAVRIGGVALDSRTLPPPTRTVRPERVTYEWTSPPYRLSVVYEAGPTWRFLSKRIAIAAPGQRFRIDDVAVFEASLTEAIVDHFVPKGARPKLGTADYGACLRFGPNLGLLVVAQNPFLQFTREGQAFSLRYRADMDWNGDDGPFLADRGLLGLYRPTGRVLPAEMQAEWSMKPANTAPGMDEAEIEAFTRMVRAFVTARPERPVNVFVPWCLNDYQIDIGTAAGRSEYRRVLDTAAALGAEYAIFAPTNSDLARREDSTDDWSWENLLWAGFGQKIRRGEWDVRTGPIPASVSEMIEHARTRKIGLLAYVYPVLAFTQDPSWLAPRRGGSARRYANLGHRRFQDWLIDTLVAFHGRLGLAGYSFDHTFLDYEGTSRYAQWAGWRRVMEELRRRIPDIVIDGRQAYHLYGPWGWLAGSYPHPTFNDEQPESFVPFPDLHFDRVSADRERYTAYRYRNYEFAPSELVPGFITHQTSRGDHTGEMPQAKTDRGVMLLPFRVRDWDHLGWRYSLLSSIAVAGWNNVIDMIPARDPDEHAAFSEADRAWFRGWIDWTRTHKEILRHTRTILGQPALGKADGTAAILGDRGFIFLFNPNARRVDARFSLDETIGLTAKGRLFRLRELHPLEGRVIGKPGGGFYSTGDQVMISLDGGSARVLQLEPEPAVPAGPLLFNAPGSVSVSDGIVSVDGVRGEVGTEQDLLVLVPGSPVITSVRVNGQPHPFTRTAAGLLSIPVHFDGVAFGAFHRIATAGETFAGGRLSGRVTVPQRVFDQLAERRRAWPIPWTAEDYQTTWLAPERLLLFVQIAEPDARWEARLTIDGRTVELRKAYSAVRAASRTFVGFYADVSLLSADREHLFELDLPPLRPGQLQGVFLENIEPEYTTRLRLDATAQRAPVDTSVEAPAAAGALAAIAGGRAAAARRR